MFSTGFRPDSMVIHKHIYSPTVSTAVTSAVMLGYYNRTVDLATDTFRKRYDIYSSALDSEFGI